MIVRAGDRAIVFNSRIYLVIGYKTVRDTMSNSGLTVCAGREGEKYKTDMTLLPLTSVLNKWR